LFLFIDLQFIDSLKFTVTTVLTGTPIASSVGLVEITAGRAAAAVPTIPMITTNAAMEILLTICLSIIVIFFVENMAFISLFTCM
jgi:capsular polysaccharide biosynthesis protein